VRAVAALFVKEWRMLLREPAGMAMLFVLPAVFILVFSLALQGVFSAGGSARRMEVLVVDEDEGPAGAELIAALDESGEFEPVRVRISRRELLSRVGGRSRLGVVIPARFSAAVSLSDEAAVEIVADPTLSEQTVMAFTGMVGTRVQALVVDRLSATIADLGGDLETLGREAVRTRETVEDLDGAVADLEAVVEELRAKLDRAAAMMPPAMAARLDDAKLAKKRRELSLALEDIAARRPDLSGPAPSVPSPPVLGAGPRVTRVTAGGGSEPTPTSVQQNVPGWTVFALFWIVQVLAISIINERTSGAYKRILTAPVGRGAYLAGKALPYLTVNLLQAASMFALGTWILPLLGAPPLHVPDVTGVVVLTVATSLSAIGLGLLMSQFSDSSFLIASASAVTLIVMGVLAGIMVPRFVMPPAMQHLCWLVPQGWALEGYLDVLVRGAPARQVLGHAAAILGFGAACTAAALLRMRGGGRAPVRSGH
jgi:ABC-2 type transport system permease protein